MRKAISHLKKSDPVMAQIIERVGAYKIEYREPVFQTLVRSIVYQQLHGKAAATIFGRLKDAAKADPLTPESILRLRPQRLRALGLSPQKLSYIRELARLTRAGAVDFERCASLADEAVIEHLTRVKGVGVWTVQMFLIFALRRPDVLPTGDLGIRAAMKKAYHLPDLPKPDEMARIASAWRPYCSVACWYLWRSLDNFGAM
jgi:DNA-3-methyladenine glycosylase II